MLKCDLLLWRILSKISLSTNADETSINVTNENILPKQMFLLKSNMCVVSNGSIVSDVIISGKAVCILN